MEIKTLKIMQCEMEFGDITQIELDKILYQSVANNLYETTKYLLNLPGNTVVKPSQDAVNAAVTCIFNSLEDAAYSAKMCNLLMQISSNKRGSCVEIDTALMQIAVR